MPASREQSGRADAVHGQDRAGKAALSDTHGNACRLLHGPNGRALKNLSKAEAYNPAERIEISRLVAQRCRSSPVSDLRACIENIGDPESDPGSFEPLRCFGTAKAVIEICEQVGVDSCKVREGQIAGVATQATHGSSTLPVGCHACA